MGRWLVKANENAAKRRALEVHSAQEIMAPLGARPGGGKKKSSVEGGVATVARPAKKVKAPAHTWDWPFILRR